MILTIQDYDRALFLLKSKNIAAMFVMIPPIWSIMVTGDRPGGPCRNIINLEMVVVGFQPFQSFE